MPFQKGNLILSISSNFQSRRLYYSLVLLSLVSRDFLVSITLLSDKNNYVPTGHMARN